MAETLTKQPTINPTSNVNENNDYNVTPYPSFSFSHTHPSHLYTLAKLFKLKPKAVETAKVLELGCASGGNLIPMAFHFPKAHYLGIDLSDKQINEGVKQITDLHLNNIELRYQSILDFNTNELFDYIIVHGVYSWVDATVRDKILTICRKNLSPNGIAYISYNTLPGWNMVNSVKDLMNWHTQNISDPASKAQQARSVLSFITDGLRDDKSAYAEFLRTEIAILSNQSDNYVVHEHLSPINTPFYFHQFIEDAVKHELSYLSDAFLVTMFTGNLPPQFANELNKIDNIIVAGQYMDFIRNQRFRCTLLCHQENKVNRSLNTNDIEDFYLKFVGKADKPNFSEKDITQGVEISFSNNALTLKVHNPIAQLAMLILNEEQKPIHYNDLCKKLIQRSSIKQIDAIKRLLNEDLNLMRCVFADLIHISSYPDDSCVENKANPLACPLIRYQAKIQNNTTNRSHQNIVLDPLSKLLLPHLDGKTDVEALLTIVLQNIKQGALSVVDENKQPVTDEADITRRTRMICQNALENMAKQGMFIHSK